MTTPEPTAQPPAPAAKPLVIACRPLPDFDRASLEDVRRAFESATPCSLRQAWQPAASPGFAPAVVRTGWRDNSLLVFAELTDVDIHSHATAHNLRNWELGDVFELFFRPAGQEPYAEFQVTPDNWRLQLRYANRSAVDLARRTGNFEAALIPGELFPARTWVRSREGEWCILAEIPAGVVDESTGSLVGRQWHFSFSRYDYTRGREEPVISSTSPHAVADFHRQQEWGVLCFQKQS